MITLNIMESQKSYAQFNYYINDDDTERHFLLDRRDLEEILSLMNDLDYSVLKCFQRVTGKDMVNVKRVFLQVKIEERE